MKSLIRSDCRLGRATALQLALLAVLLVAGSAFAQTPGQASAPSSGALYQWSVRDRPAPNGKKLDLRMREIERQPESSVVEIDLAPDADAATWGPILEGLCGLMQARGQPGAVSEQISVQPLRFRMTFPDKPAIDDRPGPPRLVLGERECSAIHRQGG